MYKHLIAVRYAPWAVQDMTRSIIASHRKQVKADSSQHLLLENPALSLGSVRTLYSNWEDYITSEAPLIRNPRLRLQDPLPMDLSRRHRNLHPALAFRFRLVLRASSCNLHRISPHAKCFAV